MSGVKFRHRKNLLLPRWFSHRTDKPGGLKAGQEVIKCSAPNNNLSRSRGGGASVCLRVEEGFYTARVWPLSTPTLLCHFLPSGEFSKAGLPPITGFPGERLCIICLSDVTKSEMNLSYTASNKSGWMGRGEVSSNCSDKPQNCSEKIVSA